MTDIHAPRGLRIEHRAYYRARDFLLSVTPQGTLSAGLASSPIIPPPNPIIARAARGSILRGQGGNRAGKVPRP
jgi:hypothetical protein